MAWRSSTAKSRSRSHGCTSAGLGALERRHALVRHLGEQYVGAGPRAPVRATGAPQTGHELTAAQVRRCRDAGRRRASSAGMPNSRKHLELGIRWSPEVRPGREFAARNQIGSAIPISARTAHRSSRPQQLTDAHLTHARHVPGRPHVLGPGTRRAPNCVTRGRPPGLHSPVSKRTWRSGGTPPLSPHRFRATKPRTDQRAPTCAKRFRQELSRRTFTPARARAATRRDTEPSRRGRAAAGGAPRRAEPEPSAEYSSAARTRTQGALACRARARGGRGPNARGAFEVGRALHPQGWGRGRARGLPQLWRVGGGGVEGGGAAGGTGVVCRAEARCPGGCCRQGARGPSG